MTVSLLFIAMLLVPIVKVPQGASADSATFYVVHSLEGGRLQTSDKYPPYGNLTSTTDSIGQVARSFSPTYMTMRTFLSFNTSTVPSNAVILSVSLRVRIETDASSIDFNVQVWQTAFSSWPPSWNATGGFVGTLFNTASISAGAWYQVSMPVSVVVPGGYSQFMLNSSRDSKVAPDSTLPEFINLYDGGSSSPAELQVAYAIGGTPVGIQLTNGSWLNSTILPEISEWNLTYDQYAFAIDTVPNSLNIVMTKGSSDWSFVSSVPYATATETSTTLKLSSVYSSICYRLWFTVPKVAPYSTVHVSLYNAFTGAGMPWGSLMVMMSPGATYNASGAEQMPRADYPLEPNTVYTLRVEDFFGNGLIDYTVMTSSSDIYANIPVPTYSWTVWNMNDQPVLLHIFWNNSGAPYEFFVGPHWQTEQLLKGGNYTFEVTFYDSNGTVGETVFYYRTIPMQGLNASFLFINGTTLSEIVSSVQGMQSSQQVITSLLMPSTVVIYDNLPLAPTKLRTLTVDNGLKLDPFLILQATTYQNGTGTSVALWSPHPSLVGATYYIDSDSLAFSGNYQSHVWVNTTSGSNLLNSVNLPATLNLDGQNVTVQSNQSVTVSRATTWREISEYTVTYYASLHEYKATLTLNDTTSLDYYSPYWFISFPRNASVDQSTVTVYDVNNALTLTNGNNFEVTAGGVHMVLSRLNASETRTFTFTYWDANGTNGIGAPNLIAQSYTTGTLNGNSMLYTAVQWMNPWSTAYSGEMYVTLNFTGGDQLVLASITVVDQSSNRQLPVNDWVYTGRTIIILTDGVGSVGVGQGKNFGIYFTLSSTATQTKTDFFFGPIVYNGMMLYIGSVALSWALVFLAVGWAAAIIPSVEPRLRRRYGDGTQTRIILMVCITIIVSAAAGVLA